jgi:hypothetical protein
MLDADIFSLALKKSGCRCRMTASRIKRIKTSYKITEKKIALHQPYFTVHQLILKIKLIVLWVTLGFRNKHQNISS